MKVRIHWTTSAIDHISRHRVTRREIEEVFDGALYARRQGQRFLFLGRTENRFLLIVIEASSRSPGEFEVVTARDATAKEKRLFKRRGK